ncbi:MAG: Spo11/DNA topoisomerase VI subunit A [Monoraphidium minutum]|nr:MAG: Spo11/DNA topoisomerase VI subunit A [Monoraphidium minutum]
MAILGGLGDGLTESESGEEDARSEGSEGGSGAGGSGSGSGDDGGEDHGSEGGSQRGGGSEDADGSGSGSGSDDEGGGVPSDVDPDDLVEADFGLDRSSVLARIEGFISDAVAAIAHGQLPELEVVSTAAGNTHMVAEQGAPGGGGGDDEDSEGGGEDDDGGGSEWLGSGAAGAASEGDLLTLDGSDGGGAAAPRQGRARARPRGARRLRLGSLTQTKSMTFAQGRQAHSVARVFSVLDAVHELLLLGPPLFPNAAAVTAAIQGAASLLRVPRGSLGIACSPRGAAAGAVALREGPGGAWVDCGALGVAGYAIPGELAAVERISFRVSARFILVVEKDCIFQRLTEDRLHERLPLALVTAKGQPDLATRAFLCRLSAAAPGVPVLGLVDWNPSGVSILCTYKFGNARLGLEGTRYAVPHLRWLGVLGAMLPGVPPAALHPLTGRDAALLAGLRARLAGQRGWLDELRDMEQRGQKCDIEALYSLGGFEGLHRQLARHILQQRFI